MTPPNPRLPNPVLTVLALAAFTLVLSLVVLNVIPGIG